MRTKRGPGSAPFVGLLVAALLLAGLASSTDRSARAMPDVDRSASGFLPGSPARILTDVPDPVRPVGIELVGQLGGPTRAIVAQGAIVYLGIGPRLAVLNVADAARPVAIGWSPILSDTVYGLAVAGGYAYVANGRAGLTILDLYDNAKPRVVGAFPTQGDALGVAVAGRYAYIGDHREGSPTWLRVLDVSNPAAPAEAGSVGLSGARWVAVSGRYEYG